MTKRTRIVAIGGEAEAAQDQEPFAETVAPLELHDEYADPAMDKPRAARRAWLPQALALAALAGWTAYFAWAHFPEFLTQSSPTVWIRWLGDWSLPALVIGVAWLITMRSSQREANRFGNVARVLADESTRLEARLLTVNQELSLAREFLTSQGRELESLGRVAVERLSRNAEQLQGLIKDNCGQVETIGHVSDVALGNMERLRGQLPVIASAAKDVTNNIAAAGRTANTQLQELILGFRKLNEFGQASERQTLAIRSQVSEAVEEFSRQANQLDEVAQARFAAMTENGAAFRAQIEGQEVEALAAIRNRAKTLAEELEGVRGSLDSQEAESLNSLRARLLAVRDESAAVGRSMREAEASALASWSSQIERMQADVRAAIDALEATDMQAIAAARTRFAALAEETERLDSKIEERNRLFADEMDRRRSEAEAREDEAMVHLRQRIAQLDIEIEARRARHTEQTTTLIAHGEAIQQAIAAFDDRLEQSARHGEAVGERIGASLQALTDKLAASRDVLNGSERQIAELNEASVRLLELIRASAEHGRADIPAALAESEATLSQVEGRVFALRSAVDEARSGSESLSNYVLASHQGLASTRAEMAQLHEEVEQRSAEHARSLSAIGNTLGKIAEESRSVAEQARDELTQAIALLEHSARDAVDGIERDSTAAIAQVAERLGTESSAVLDRALRTRAAEVAGQLEQAAAHAAGVSREAAMQLRDQLAKVNELAGNLETRVSRAREQAEEHVDNDFARRVALITDSLNSNAIDIAKALSQDVADTAWAAYLRGDRGIFTRRTVSLLDSGEARSIAQHYEADREFRDHVSRYIHDFEAMLRQLLSTRDGHALGVTVLSSDMGKLYVALAQAIERLRN